MIGWRGKLGFIIPSINTVVESEMPMMAPRGVSIHYARARSINDTAEELIRMAEEAPKAAQELADAEVEAIAFTCTGASLLRGPGYDKHIQGLIEGAVHIPAITTSTAVVEALKAQHMTKICIASPYEDWLNEKEKVFLEHHGVTVVAMKGLGITDIHIADLPPERVYDLAREVLKPEADGMFISCTDFRTAEILQCLEDDIHRPVVSSNQATLWAMLRQIGVRPPIAGFGSLLRNL